MASVQELLLAAQAKQKKSPLSMIADLINTGVTGYQEGQQMKQKAELNRVELAKKLIEIQQAKDEIDAQKEMRAKFADILSLNSESNIRSGLAGTGEAAQPTTPKAKINRELNIDAKGKLSGSIKIAPPPEPDFSFIGTDGNGNPIFADKQGNLKAGFLPGGGPLKPKPTAGTGAGGIKLPPGYQWTADGSGMEPIPGGPADMKNKANRAKVEGALNDTLREYDNMIKEAQAIKGDPYLGSSTGMTSSLAEIPGTPQRRVYARMQTLKAKTLLNVLSSLKQLSATGASGFGSLSEVEGENIRNSVSSLDLKQQESDVKDSLDRFISEMEAKKKTLQSTFNDSYGGAGPSPSVEPPPASPPPAPIATPSASPFLPTPKAPPASEGTIRVKR